MRDMDSLMKTAVDMYRPDKSVFNAVKNKIIKKSPAVSVIFISNDFENIFKSVFASADKLMNSFKR